MSARRAISRHGRKVARHNVAARAEALTIRVFFPEIRDIVVLIFSDGSVNNLFGSMFMRDPEGNISHQNELGQRISREYSN